MVEREGYCPSLSNDTTYIRILDIISHRTLQTVHNIGKEAHFCRPRWGQRPSFCNLCNDSGLSAPPMLPLLPRLTYPAQKGSYSSHLLHWATYPVATLKYNLAFKQLITWDLGLTVIWDPITGSFLYDQLQLHIEP
jgi:hypothetical protein